MSSEIGPKMLSMSILIAVALLAPASVVADGRIAGKVTRPDGSPITGALVSVDSVIGPEGSVLTDAQGRYMSPQLEAGPYRVRVAEIEGRYGITYPHVSCTSDVACFQGSQVPVRDGETTTGIDFVMRIGSSLAGRVLRTNGDPAESSPLVTAFDREGNAIGSSEYHSGETGEFSIGLIPPGRYTLLLTRGGFYRFSRIYPDLSCTEAECDVRFGGPIELAEGESRNGLDFVVPDPIEVHGAARDALTGELIANADVDLYDARTGERIHVGSSQGNGTQIFSVLPGSYYPVAKATAYLTEGLDGVHHNFEPFGLQNQAPTELARGGRLEVRPNEPAQFTIELDRAPRITGRVLQPDGQPATSCLVQAFRAPELERQESASCNGDEHFELFLPPGAYHLLVFGDGSGLPNAGALPGSIPCSYGPYGERCDIRQAPAVVVTLGSHGELDDIRLPAPAVLTGAISRAAGGIGHIELYDERGHLARRDLMTGFDSYRIENLAPGRYKVMFHGEPPAGSLVYPGLPCHRSVCDPLQGATVVIGPGQTVTGVDLDVPAASPRACEIDEYCLNEERFRVKARWTDPQGATGDAQIDLSSIGDTAYYWFFSHDNIELMVKVLDACQAPYERFWVFAAGTTNVGVEIEVEDTVTGAVKTYRHTGGPAFAPVLDTDAFVCGAGAGSDPAAVTVAASSPAPPAPAAPEPPPTTTFCSRSDRENLCLLDGRFRVDVTWNSFDGSEGLGIGDDNVGSFWFFSPNNVELLVKALDGCSINGHYWLFGSGLTNVGVRMVVTDTHTDRQKTYENALGHAFAPILDTQAFACWPE
jgi:hypothetical protein